MIECTLKFSPTSVKDAGSFRLIELPLELCTFVDSAVNSVEPINWTVKGQSNEDAVLCTSDKTYALRSVVLSNTVLIITSGGSNDIVICDQLNEILELVPSIPKLHKLTGWLKDMVCDDLQDVQEMSIAPDGEGRLEKKWISYEDARLELQASDAELERGLRDRRILVIDGRLRPIAPTYLHTILELLLTYLVSLSLSHNDASVEELTSTLVDEHEIPSTVSSQVMSWFGTIQQGRWAMNVETIVREIGIGLLRLHKDEPIPEDVFITKWKVAVGDTFESQVSLSLLSGNYLLSPNVDLVYFPASSLPIDPHARFGDLFLTRPRWRSQDIAPYLADIAVDEKERDKLLLKFARVTTDPEGVWYTARTRI